ncbi:MAG: tetratricopeptide repeat protein [Thermodesulfobacteriota bacterium]
MRYTKTETEVAENIIAILLLAWVAFFLILTTTQVQHWDSDIFWALRTGAWIAEHWKVPFTDPLSYTFAGSPWVDFTWGFQVIAHAFYTKLGGWSGLYILQLLLTFAIFSALFLNVRLLTVKRLWLPALLMALALACAFPRLFIRPHLFGFLLISLYLLILNVNEKKETSWLIFLILPLQVLWVNLHSSAILGVFIVWAYASGEFIDDFLRLGFKGFGGVVRKNKRLLILAIIVPFVTLLNPYGLKLAIFPFIHQGGVNADALRHIGEWTKLPLKELFLFFYPVPITYFAFRVLFYLGLLSLALNWRRVKTRDLVLFFGAAYMAVSHVRWVGQFAFFAAPVIAFNLSAYLEGRAKADHRWIQRAGLAMAIFISIFLGLNLMDGTFRSNLGIGLRADKYPVGSVRFLRDTGLKGNIYNDYDFGGYLTFTYPELKVFIDGRTPTVYSPHFYWKSRQTQSKEGWERLSSEYAFTMALVKLDQPLCSILYKSEAWTPVVFDDISALYLKKDSGFKEVLSRNGLSFTPCSTDKKYPMPEGSKERLRMREGLLTVMSAIGDGKEGMDFAYPQRLMGLLLAELGEEGHKEKAVTALLKAAAAPGGNSFIYYDLGLALGRVKRYDEAISAFKTSIRMNKAFKRSYLALGLTYFDNKNYEDSARVLERYVRLADDNAEYTGLKTLGRSCFKLGRLDCAEDALKRAEFMADDDKKRGEAAYYLGNTLFEAGRLDEGALYYSRAIERDPSYKEVFLNLQKMLAYKNQDKKASAIKGILEKKQIKD